jgi:Cu(I)/Ag(I) efflux system membrane protein CusA/SilA
MLVVGGEAARRQLRRDAIPDLSEPQIVLVAEWPFHAAAAVTAAVTDVLTAALDGVPGATAVRGSSMSGLAYVDVVFDAAADLPRGRTAVDARLAALAPRLPHGVRVRVAPEAASTGWLLAYALAAPSTRESLHDDGESGLSLVTLRRFHDDVMQPKLAALPGVAEVAAVGGETQELLVALDPDRLRAADLAFSDVAAALAARLERPGASVAALGALPVTGDASGGTTGGTARLDALGELRLGRAMAGGIADLDGGLPVVAGIVIARGDADPIAVAAAVRRALDELRPQLPAGVEPVVVYDRSALSRRVARTLVTALAEELAVVALVVLLFLLDGPSALVPVATLLAVLALTFVAMAAAGIPATVMSLGGIAIALGLAVDAELVALEACHRRLEGAGGLVDGAARRARLLAAAGAFAPAIVTSLAIAALAFAPAFAFTGETGRLLRPLVVTKTLIIVAAMLVTLLLAPALRDRLVGGRIVPELRHPLTRALVRAYRPFVAFALLRPRLTLLTAALLAASCVPLVDRLGSEFLPQIDEGDLLFMPTTVPDVPPEVAAAELLRLDRLLARRPEVALVFGKLGRADSATDPAPCTMAEILIRLRPRRLWPMRFHRRWYSDWAPPLLARALARVWPDQRPLDRAELVMELDRATRRPGWTSAWTAPVRARMDMMATGVRTPIAVRIVAADAARRDHIADQLHALLLGLPGTRSVVNESLGGETLVAFVPDPRGLAHYHVDEARARATAELLLGGGVVGEVERNSHRLPVRIVADRTPRPLDEQLRAATVRAKAAGGGQAVPLALLGRPRVVRAAAMLRSERGRAVAYVNVDVADGTDLGVWVAQAERALADAAAAHQLVLGPDERLEWTGQYQLLAAGRRRLALVVPLTALSLLLLLFAQFRSWTEALIVLVSVPFALVGSLWTLYLLDYRLSPPVWVGLLSVVGLAMQTGVVMVVYIDDAFYRRVRAGRLRDRDDIVAAHAEGTIARLRPKLMTIMTMAAALLPIVGSQGAGAEITKRVAAPMLGGLLSSAFVTLEVIPVLYTLWRQHQLRRAQRRGVPLAQVIGCLPAWARSGHEQGGRHDEDCASSAGRVLGPGPGRLQQR